MLTGFHIRRSPLESHHAWTLQQVFERAISLDLRTIPLQGLRYTALGCTTTANLAARRTV